MQYYSDGKQTFGELTLGYREKVKSFCTQTVELWRVAISTAFVTAIAIFILWLMFRQPATSALSHPTQPSTHEDLEQAIKILYHPILHGYSGDFTTIEGDTFSTSTIDWNVPLGNDLCIVDIDSRPMNGSNQIWSPDDTFDWKHVKGSQSGYFNHYIYSRIHGYRYIYMQATVPEGWAAPWARPGVFKHLLPQCRVLLYADSDVIIPNLRLPVEWLLNYWQIPTNQSILASAEDALNVPGLLPWTQPDSRGNPNNNGGFIILHNSADHVLDALLTKWANCVSEVDYPGCANYTKKWPAEQGALNEFVRYDFPEYVMRLPCNEAMGWPEWQYCKGQLVRHYTVAKDQVHGAIEASLAQGLMKVVHENMVAHKSELYEFRGFVGEDDAGGRRRRGRSR